MPKKKKMKIFVKILILKIFKFSKIENLASEVKSPISAIFRIQVFWPSSEP